MRRMQIIGKFNKVSIVAVFFQQNALRDFKLILLDFSETEVELLESELLSS